MPCPADMDRAIAAERRRSRRRAQVRHVEADGFGAAQPPPVDDLQQRRIPERGQRPLAAQPGNTPHLGIRVIEPRLRLIGRQRTTARVTLIAGDMPGHVPLRADLHRMRPKPFLALSHPPIARIAHEPHEQPELDLIAADRRRRPRLRTRAQPRREILQITRTPLPRILIVKSANRRTDHSRRSTVAAANIRLCCCASHPDNIASNTARSGSSSATPCAIVNGAAPGNQRPEPIPTLLHQTPQHARTTTSAPADQPPPGRHPSTFIAPASSTFKTPSRRRMMHQMQFRSVRRPSGRSG